MKKYWSSFFALLFPRTCLGCSKPLIDVEELICLHCEPNLQRTDYHLHETNSFYHELNAMTEIDGAFAYLKFHKKGLIQTLLHQLKYNGNDKVGFTLGKWFAIDFQEELKPFEFDMIIPIPLHKSKKRARGYNQAELIANGIKEVTGIHVNAKVLIRTKKSISQTKKGKLARWKSVIDLYSVQNSQDIKGKNVILIDDVITTGATTMAAVDILKASGAKSVVVACLATGK